MSELLIRAARPADTPTIVRFNIALAEESEGLRLDPQTVEAGVRRMFSDPALGRYLVAASPGEETQAYPKVRCSECWERNRWH